MPPIIAIEHLSKEKNHSLDCGQTRYSEIIMPGANPFFTVITATRNAAATLPRLLASLACQTCRDFELVIQDGASTDDTVAVAESWRDRLPALSIVSEPDTGIYDAWNKALPRIRGNWVLFLGADDFLLNASTLAAASQELATLPEGILYAASPVILVNADGCALDMLLPSRTLEKSAPLGMPVPHQGLFHRARLFLKERFALALRISSDYDFFCRTAKPDNLIYLDKTHVCMGLGGLTGNLHGMLCLHLENLRISRHYFPAAKHLFLFWRIACSLTFKGIAKLNSEAAGGAVADLYRKVQGKPTLWSKREIPVLRVFSLAPENTLPAVDRAGTSREKVMFSLLVATAGRIEQLRRLFASLVEQSQHDFEILIADQNPPGFLDGLYAEFQDRLPFRVIPVANKGVSLARNALLPHASGIFIAFPDDDCWYSPDTLEQAATFFAANPHAHALLGQWHDPAGTTQPNPRRSGCVINRFTAFRNAETYVQFYRKEVVDIVGGFDPELGPGTGLPYGGSEDIDYLVRAITSGFTVVAAPNVQVYHPDISHNPPSLEKIRAYSASRMHLLRKHNFPLWFKLAHIAYPLLRATVEGKKAWPYRKAMFLARLTGLFAEKSVVNA